MLEVEVLGASLAAGVPSEDDVRRLCGLACERRGVGSAHVAIEFVSAARIAELNACHRGKREPTDVLSFPIDGVDQLDPPGAAAPRELGDVVICPEHTRDIREAVVHGILHLLGMDHETDEGEMLALQSAILEAAGR